MLGGCQGNRSLKVPSEGNLSKTARSREGSWFHLLWLYSVLKKKKNCFWLTVAKSFDGMECVHTPVNDCCLDFGKSWSIIEGGIRGRGGVRERRGRGEWKVMGVSGGTDGRGTVALVIWHSWVEWVLPPEETRGSHAHGGEAKIHTNESKPLSYQQSLLVFLFWLLGKQYNFSNL